MTLLVPMHIDALVVGDLEPQKKMFQWTDLAPDYSLLEGDYRFGSELCRAFDQASGPGTGVHLHFRLPRAFAHGTQKGDADPSFPVIPDRWLVQRFGGERGGSYGYTAWLVKSDVLEPSGAGIPWPTFHEHEPLEIDRLGAVAELTADPGEAEESPRVSVTALGPGNPAFSAYYPACRSVLGFYDPMDKLDIEVSLSYLVTGWYSRASDDPLHGASWRTGSISPSDAERFRKQEGLAPDAELGPDQRARLLVELRDAWFAERNWSCRALQDGGGTTAGKRPSALVCHGSVTGVTWQGPDWNYWQPPGSEATGNGRAGASMAGPRVFPPNIDTHEKAYRLAVGNTPAEALAALLVPGEIEQDLLTALPADLQPALSAQPSGPGTKASGQRLTAAQMLRELHDRRFRSVSGGTAYELQPKGDPSRYRRARESDSITGRQAVSVPEALRLLLARLNEEQSSADRLSRRFEDRRWQVYALWSLWTSEFREHLRSSRAQELEARLAVSKSALEAEREGLAEAVAKIEQAIENLLGEHDHAIVEREEDAAETQAASHGKLVYRLVRTGASPFYLPNEPVLTVSGPALARAGTWEPRGSLECRLSEEIVSAVRLRVPGASVKRIPFQWLESRLFGAAGPSSTEFLWADDFACTAEGTLHRALLGEALLLDGRHAAAIAEAAAVSEGIVELLQEGGDVGSLDSQLEPEDHTWVGSLPDRAARFDWERNPWIPLFMVWSGSWRADYPSTDEPLSEELIVERWRLGASGDLEPQEGPAAEVAGITISCQGFSMLTATASTHLAHCLQLFDASHPLVDVLKNARAQSQTLDGFNAALISQQAGLQLPPLDFKRFFLSREKRELYLDGIHTHLNSASGAGVEGRDRRWVGAFRTAPDPGGQPFLPIRSGRFEIERLSIVDAFGQTLHLPVSQIKEPIDDEAPSLRPAHTCRVERRGGITLRPRFLQPMRLRFDLESASGSGEHVAGPVCGWILPNHLDKSLTLYSAAGRPLGALQERLGAGTGDRAFSWVEVPAADTGQRVLPEDNAHLRHFRSWVESLDADDGGAFRELLNRHAAATDQRAPEEDPGVSVLVGRPLALVRASLRFEIAGLPAHRPERASAAKDAPADPAGTAPDRLETRRLEKVRWPVRLGDLDARDDGLVGFFCCAEDGGVAGGGLLPVRSIGEPDHGLTVDCEHKLHLTLLMDPQARVHATTGVLPRASLELPPEQVTGAKRAREVFFQTAPVLGLSPTPRMPRPSDDYGEWSWAYQPDVTQWTIDPNLVEATERAGFANAWPTITEGWLKLAIARVRVLSFWLREPATAVAKGDRVHLAWSLQGAESLELERIIEGKGVKIDSWPAPPFPREYCVEIGEETTYRLTAYAQESESHSLEMTVNIGESGARSAQRLRLERNPE